MGLLTKEVKIKWSPSNKKWYINKGYTYTKMKDEFEVKIEDLTHGSNAKVSVKCDCEDCKNPYLKPMKWQDYLRYVKDDGKYYCYKCILNKSKSFEQWCIENNRQDVLDRWDYELNDCKPNEVGYGSNKNYYFKCPKGLHKSELKSINRFTNGQKGSIKCNQCNSFAQWGIDNICEDFLEKYWDYEKNIVNPWVISCGSNKYVYVKCQEKDYHCSYSVSCSNFIINNSRCPYCRNSNGTVCFLDSLGTLYPQVLEIWSNKNEKSPYEYSPKSKQKIWWKCLNRKHKDYYRDIKSSNFCEFRCPYCQFSEGEKRIEQHFTTLNFKQNEDYIPQKEFDGLIGLGNGNLSYDFYLPKHNLLIEYQGEQHERPVDFEGKGKKYAKEKFKQQQEHDKRKRDYANTNNIKLLEIWYWDYNNIEKILDNYLHKCNGGTNY